MHTHATSPVAVFKPCMMGKQRQGHGYYQTHHQNPTSTRQTSTQQHYCRRDRLLACACVDYPDACVDTSALLPLVTCAVCEQCGWCAVLQLHLPL